MSCDVAMAAFLMFTSAGPSPAVQPVPAVAGTPLPVAQDPFFKDIVARAGGLKGQVEAYRAQVAQSATPLPLTGFDAFTAQISQLSALDQQGHVILAARGTDGDLKCILHGISQDLPLKLAAIAAAKTGHDEDLALRDMQYLLRDNVEVITAPPTPPA
jgi:hypothetical protein